MNALRSLSGQLARVKTPTVLAAGLLTVLLMLYIFGVILPAIRSEVGQPRFEVVDAYLVRTPSMTFDNLETLGAKGRSIYLRMAAADVLIPAVYAVLFGGLMARAWGVTPAPRKHGVHPCMHCILCQPYFLSGMTQSWLQRAWHGCCRCFRSRQPQQIMWRMLAPSSISGGCRSTTWGWPGSAQGPHS